MPDTVVVKIGGSTLGTGDTTLADVVALQRRGLRPVVVHGGGALISEGLKRPRVPTRVERPLLDLLDDGFVPVLAPIAVEWRGRAPSAQLLNINADTAAGAVAAALSA